MNEENVFSYFERTGIDLPRVRGAADNTLHLLEKWERNSVVRMEQPEQVHMVSEIESVLEDMWEGGMLAFEEESRGVNPDNQVKQLFLKKRYAFQLFNLLRESGDGGAILATTQLYDWLVALLRMRSREEFRGEDVLAIGELRRFLTSFREAIIKESSV